MSKSLVINADDFGLTDGVCRGIVECAEAGGITSTSAMMCKPEFVANVEKYLCVLTVPCGVHLQLTTGRALSSQMRKYRAASGGNFLNSPNDVKFPAELVGIEWAAQVEFYRKNFGDPSHLDTHHGLQYRNEYSEVFLQLASSEGLPARGNDPEFYHKAKNIGVGATFAVTGHKGEWTGTHGGTRMALKSVRELLKDTPEDVAIELIAHPGFNDAELQAISTFTTCRKIELDVLRGEEFAAGIKSLGVRLISFAALDAGINSKQPISQ